MFADKNEVMALMQGLEALLVECAVVNDDIERDCFVSRVYCWFTEKLGERRELPRKAPRLENLRDSIMRLDGEYTHTMKGLEKFDPENNFEATIRAENERINLAPENVRVTRPSLDNFLLTTRDRRLCLTIITPSDCSHQRSTCLMIAICPSFKCHRAKRSWATARSLSMSSRGSLRC